MSEVKKRRTIFDHIRGVTIDKVPWDHLSEEDRKSWNTFLINRWLSMEMLLVPIIDELQQIQSQLTDEQVYKMYLEVLPQNNFFFKYIKKNKHHKYDKDLVNHIAKHFTIGFVEAVSYIETMSLTAEGKEELESILRMYGLTEDEIKPLLRTVR